jgi:hypothetical protein
VPAVIAYRPHLRRTLTVAFLVGSVFVLINQFGLLLSGQATPVVWLKAVATYVVPFCVSNYGILSETRRLKSPEASRQFGRCQHT